MVRSLLKFLGRLLWSGIDRAAAWVGVLLGGSLLLCGLYLAIFLIGGFFQVLIYFAHIVPVLGIPLLLAVLAYCLWRAFGRRNSAAEPEVLRGRTYVEIHQQSVHFHTPTADGEPQRSPTSRPSTPDERPRPRHEL